MTEQTLDVPAGGDSYSFGPVTPARAMVAAGGGGFTYAAASFQQQTSALAATARVTHQPIGQLSADIRSLARDFPIGTAAAVATVSAVEQLGLSSRNQVPQIRALSKEMVQLAGATGTAPAAIATGFGQLNRQLASLDPGRVGRFGDVLTTLQAKSGAAVAGILTVSRGIAPLAQQAGIGQSAVLGISSALVKLGDDGGAAVTAVNRILGDLNTSVRTGSNQMAIYAQATGLTVRQFRELYAANPSQALTMVTESVGRSGPRGQALLGSLGLDSVRTQRSLLELSQSGGLGAQIQMAVGAYGNGSTRQASQAAYGGLLDSGAKLQSTFSELAGVAGAPLLRPMTQFTNLLAAAVHPLAALVGSGPVQRVIGVAAEIGGMGLLARRGLGLGTVAAGARQVGSSGIARGVVGGFYAGRYGDVAAAQRGGALGRYIAPVLDPARRGAGFFGTPNNMAFAATQSVGAFIGNRGGAGPRFGLLGAASLAYEGAMRATAAPFHIASVPFDQRSGVSAQYLGGRPGGAVRGLGAGLSTAVGTRDFVAARTALSDFRTEVASSSKGLRVLNATFAAGGAVARFGGTGLLGLGRTLMGPLMSPVGLALGAGIGGYEAYSHVQSARRADATRIDAQFDPGNSVRNRYNDALGLASENTTSFADSLDIAARRITGAATSMSQAMHVTAADQKAAAGQTPVTKFTGTNTQVAGQIAASFASGINPAQLTRVKQDLLAQGYTPAAVQTITASVVGQVGTGTSGLTGKEISSSVGAAVGSARAYHTGPLSNAGFQGAAAGVVNDVTGLVGLTPGGTSAGAGLQPIAIDTKTKSTIDTLASNITQQFNAYADPDKGGGPAYAVQWLFRTVNSVMDQLAASGQQDVFAYATKVFSRLLTSLGQAGKGKTSQVGLDDFTSSGKDFVHYLQTHGSNSFGGTKLGGWSGQGVTLSGAGVKRPKVDSAFLGQISSVAPAFAALYGGKASGAMAGVVPGFQAGQNQSFGSPGQLQENAEAFVRAAMAGGTGPGRLVTQATAAGQYAPMDAAFQQAVAQIAQSVFTRQVSNQSLPRQYTTLQNDAVAGIGALAGVNTTDAQNKRLAYQQVLDGVQNDERAYYQQRLMAQFNYETAARRSNEDYERSVSRETASFARQLSRQREDAAKSMYDPFERIQVHPVWDAANLLGNTTAQDQALRGQLANLRKLRSLGLSEQAITQLDLYNPAQAQQAQELVGDLTSAHSLVGQFNAQAKTRQSLSSQLLTEDPAYKRQRQDQKIAMTQQEQDHQTAMDRMAQDLHNADLTMTGDLTTLQKDTNKVLHGQVVDFHTIMSNEWAGTISDAQHAASAIKGALSGVGAPGAGGHTGGGSLTNSGSVAGGGVSGGGYGNKAVTKTSGFSDTINPTTGKATGSTVTTSYVKPGTGSVYTGGISGKADTAGADYQPTAAFMKAHPADPQYNRTIAKAMMPAWSSGKEWAAWDQLWGPLESAWNQYADNGVSSAYGIPQAINPEAMGKYGKDWRTNPATQIRWGIDYIQHHINSDTGKPYGDPQGALDFHLKHGWYGSGAIFTGPQVIGVGERGNEAVLPLDSHGAAFIADVLRSYVGADDMRSLGAGLAGGVTIGHLEEHHTYDNGQHIHGPVTVKANSPAEWAAAANARARSTNLTTPRSVRWSRSSA